MSLVLAYIIIIILESSIFIDTSSRDSFHTYWSIA